MFNWLKNLFVKKAEFVESDLSLELKKAEFVESDLSLEQMKEMVEIPEKKYSIGRYQVTQALWKSVMGNNPSHFKGSSRPVGS